MREHPLESPVCCEMMHKRPLRGARRSVTAPLPVCCRLMESQGANLLPSGAPLLELIVRLVGVHDVQAGSLATELGIGQPPGQSSRCFHLRQTETGRADFKLLSFLSVGTKQQSRLKYSQSLMSIPFVPSGRSMVVFTVTPLGTTPRASLWLSANGAHHGDSRCGHSGWW